MKLEVNVTKGRAFAVVGAVLILAGIFGVIAAVNSALPNHPASQVEMASGSSLQEDIDNGVIVNSASLAIRMKRGLYGYCMVSYDFNERPACASTTVKAPASCVAGATGTVCACPVEYTKVVTGSSVSDINNPAAGGVLAYSCYLN